MCVHYEATTDRERYRSHFGVEPPPDADRHDIWPGYAGSFIRKRRHGDHAGEPPAIEAMAGLFGLIPHWGGDTTIARRTCNARSETVTEKPSYHDAWDWIDATQGQALGLLQQYPSDWMIASSA